MSIPARLRALKDSVTASLLVRRRDNARLHNLQSTELGGTTASFQTLTPTASSLKSQRRAIFAVNESDPVVNMQGSKDWRPRGVVFSAARIRGLHRIHCAVYCSTPALRGNLQERTQKVGSTGRLTCGSTQEKHTSGGVPGGNSARSGRSCQFSKSRILPR